MSHVRTGVVASLSAVLMVSGATAALAETPTPTNIVVQTWNAVPNGGSPFQQTNDRVWLLDGRTAVGEQVGSAFVILGRFQGPGQYPISGSTDNGVYFGQPNICMDALGGTADVTEAEYDESGLATKLAVDVHWTCNQTYSGGGHTIVRLGTAVPFTRVEMIPPPTVDAPVSEGDSVGRTWIVRNTGTTPAGLGSIEATDGAPDLSVDASSCTGSTLAPGEECTVKVAWTAPELDDDEPQRFSGATLAAQVEGYGVSKASDRVTIVPRMSMGVYQGFGATPSLVQVSWTPGDAGALPRHYEVQRLDAGAWVTVGQTEAASWREGGLTAGQTRTYRARSVDSSGRTTDWSGPMVAKAGTSGLLVAGADSLGAVDLSTSPADLGLALREDPDTTGVDVSPTRRQVAITSCTSAYVCSLKVVTPEGSGAVTVYGEHARLTTPRFSPDGRKVLVTEERQGSSSVPFIIDLANHVRTDLPTAGMGQAWHPDGKRILLTHGNGPMEWILPVVGHVGTVSGSDGADIASVSPSGAIVYRTPSASQLRLVSPAGLTSVLVDHVLVQAVRFNQSGTRVAFVSLAGGGWPVRIVEVATRSVGPALPATAQDIAWLDPHSAPPGVPSVTVAPVVGSTSTATITVRDSDDAVSGLTTSCAIDGAAWKACGSSLAMSALTSGRHRLSARSTDPSGAVGPTGWTDFTVDTTAPTATLRTPSSVLVASRATIGWTAADSGGASLRTYDVRARTGSIGAMLGAYQYPGSWQGVASQTLSVTLLQGYQYCWSVRARDTVGNVGAWSSEKCSSSMLDDRGLLRSSARWTRGTSTSYAYSTYSRSTTAGISLSRSGVKARRVAVVVTTCPTCGSVDVYHAGVKLGRISTYSSSTRTKQVKWLPLQSTTRSGTVVIRTTSPALTLIDGIATQH